MTLRRTKMNKGMIIIAGILFLSSIMLLSVHSQEDMAEVDRSAFTNPQRPVAVFKHDVHNQNAEIENCNECHHVYEDGKLLEDESSEDQRCADCHGPEAEANKPSLVKAFHSNCKGCHKKQKKGPILCGECHVR